MPKKKEMSVNLIRYPCPHFRHDFFYSLEYGAQENHMPYNTPRVENGSPPALSLLLISEVPAVLAVLRVEGMADEQENVLCLIPKQAWNLRLTFKLVFRLLISYRY